VMVYVYRIEVPATAVSKLHLLAGRALHSLIVEVLSKSYSFQLPFAPIHAEAPARLLLFWATFLPLPHLSHVPGV